MMRVHSILLSLALSAHTSFPFVLRSSPPIIIKQRQTFAATGLAMSTTSTTTATTSQPRLLLVSLRDKLAAAASSSSENHHHALGRLVLASQSPRRREILDMMGLADLYTVEPSPLDESRLQQELWMGSKKRLSSTEYTCRLAEAKAKALAEADAKDRAEDRIPTFYLGSDTIVELEENVLEKPKDEADARRMLTMMSGRRHHVHTGVALYRLYREEITLVGSFTDTATVTFAEMGKDDIDAYIASGEPMDKAGSYGIQGIGGQFVTEITGDFFTVMGIPMHKTSRIVAMALQDEAARKFK
jgi:septum formation protein